MKVIVACILIGISYTGLAQQKLLLRTDTVTKLKLQSKYHTPVPLALEATITNELKQIMNEYRNAPNNTTTWATIRGKAETLLLGYFKSGKLMGTKPAEAFFVKMDITTMTAAQINSNTKVLAAGIAQYKPAEFLLIRIETKAD